MNRARVRARFILVKLLGRDILRVDVLIIREGYKTSVLVIPVTNK